MSVICRRLCAGPAPASPEARAAGANVTLRLQGVTPEQFLARQAEYNHIIAQVRVWSVILARDLAAPGEIGLMHLAGYDRDVCPGLLL